MINSSEFVKNARTSQTENADPSKGANMSETTNSSKPTITILPSQLAELLYLAETTMTGERKEKGDPSIKTLEQIAYQVIERGIAAIKQTRAQYSKNSQAIKAAKKAGLVK